MRSSRTSKGGVLLSILAVSMLGAGCQDDLPPPTHGLVDIVFGPALPVGGRVIIDGALAFQAAEGSPRDHVELLLASGRHEIEIQQDCVRIEPAASLEFDVAAGREQSVRFEIIEISAVLEVSSSPAGFAITLDGVPTGRATPSEFFCLEPGEHEVEVEPGEVVGFTLTGETAKTATLGSTGRETLAFEFVQEPLEQPRGVLVELFTATLCPNCAVAEDALHEIEITPTPPPEHLSTVEVHLAWGGSDPFYTTEIGSRRVAYYYGNDPQSAPRCYFNGADLLEGVPDPEQIRANYDARIQTHYGGEAPIGLYWTNVRIDDSLLRGDLRCVAIDDLSSLGQLDLHAFYTKDSLRTRQYPNQQNDFYGVVRDYLDEPIELPAQGVSARGSYLDRTIVFDLASDPNWPTPSVRLSAFVQERASREVLQVREVRLELP